MSTCPPELDQLECAEKRSRFKIHYSREHNHSLLTNSGVLQFSTTLNHISLGGLGGIEGMISKPQNSKERVCGFKLS